MNKELEKQIEVVEEVKEVQETKQDNTPNTVDNQKLIPNDIQRIDLQRIYERYEKKLDGINKAIDELKNQKQESSIETTKIEKDLIL